MAFAELCPCGGMRHGPRTPSGPGHTWAASLTLQSLWQPRTGPSREHLARCAGPGCPEPWGDASPCSGGDTTKMSSFTKPSSPNRSSQGALISPGVPVGFFSWCSKQGMWQRKMRTHPRSVPAVTALNSCLRAGLVVPSRNTWIRELLGF